MISPTDDESDVALARALIRAARGLRDRVAPVLAAEGLTAGQYEALEILRERGPLGVSELRKEMATTSGNLDVVLDNLVAKGLVSKRVDPADARRRVVRLTEKGRAMGRHVPRYRDALRGQMSRLTAAEKMDLARLLDRLTTGSPRSGRPTPSRIGKESYHGIVFEGAGPLA